MTEKAELEHRCHGCTAKVLFWIEDGHMMFRVKSKLCSDMCYKELEYMLKEGDLTVH